MRGMRPIFVFGMGVMSVKLAATNARIATKAFIRPNIEFMVAVIETKMAIMNAKMGIIETKIGIISAMVAIMVS